jgi:hypothetical protein
MSRAKHHVMIDIGLIVIWGVATSRVRVMSIVVCNCVFTQASRMPVHTVPLMYTAYTVCTDYVVYAQNPPTYLPA